MGLISTALLLAGTACITAALWWIHPSLGLGFFGVALIVIAFGIARLNDTAKPR